MKSQCLSPMVFVSKFRLGRAGWLGVALAQSTPAFAAFEFLSFSLLSFNVNVLLYLRNNFPLGAFQLPLSLILRRFVPAALFISLLSVFSPYSHLPSTVSVRTVALKLVSKPILFGTGQVVWATNISRQGGLARRCHGRRIDPRFLCFLLFLSAFFQHQSMCFQWLHADVWFRFPCVLFRHIERILWLKVGIADDALFFQQSDLKWEPGQTFFSHFFWKQLLF